MDKKDKKVLSKSFVTNKTLNSSSFTKLPDGSVKRKRQKGSYKDIYLEKQNFVPTQMPLSNKRNGNYSTIYNNNMLMNISNEDSNYSFKTEENDDTSLRKNSKNHSKNYSTQRKLGKTKSLNINTSNSISQSTSKKNIKNLKKQPIAAVNQTQNPQVRMAINLLNISNRSQNMSRSFNGFNDHEQQHDHEQENEFGKDKEKMGNVKMNINHDKAFADDDNDHLNIDMNNINMLQSYGIGQETFMKKTHRRYCNSFCCTKGIKTNRLMREFAILKEKIQSEYCSRNRRSFDRELNNLKSTLMYFGASKEFNDMFESLDKRRDYCMLETFNPSKFNQGNNEEERAAKGGHRKYNMIAGSLIENDKEGDYEQLRAMTNTLDEAISKKNTTKNNCIKKEEKEQEEEDNDDGEELVELVSNSNTNSNCNSNQKSNHKEFGKVIGSFRNMEKNDNYLQQYDYKQNNVMEKQQQKQQKPINYHNFNEEQGKSKTSTMRDEHNTSIEEFLNKINEKVQEDQHMITDPYSYSNSNHKQTHLDVNTMINASPKQLNKDDDIIQQNKQVNQDSYNNLLKTPTEKNKEYVTIPNNINIIVKEKEENNNSNENFGTESNSQRDLQSKENRLTKETEQDDFLNNNNHHHNQFNTRLIDISPEKKIDSEKEIARSPSFKQQIENEQDSIEYQQQEEEQQQNSFNQQELNLHYNYNDYETQSEQLRKNNNHQGTSSLKNISSERYDDDDNNEKDNEEQVKQSKITLENTVEKQIEEINKINESLKMMQETIEQTKIQSTPQHHHINNEDSTSNKHHMQSPSHTQTHNHIKHPNTFESNHPYTEDKNHHIRNLIADFRRDPIESNDDLPIKTTIQSPITEEQINALSKRNQRANNDPQNELLVSEERNDDFIIVENAFMTTTSGQLINDVNKNDPLKCTQSLNEEEIEMQNKLLTSSQNFMKRSSNHDNNINNYEEDDEDYNEGQERVEVQEHNNNNNYSSKIKEKEIENDDADDNDDMKEHGTRNNREEENYDPLTTEQRDEENNMEISLSLSQSDNDNDLHCTINYDNNPNDNNPYHNSSPINKPNDSHKQKQYEEIAKIINENQEGGAQSYQSPTKEIKKTKLTQPNKDTSPNDKDSNPQENRLKAAQPKNRNNRTNQEEANNNNEEEDNNENEQNEEEIDEDEYLQYQNYYYKHRDEIEEVDEENEESFKRSIGANMLSSQNNTNTKGKNYNGITNPMSEEKDNFNHKIKALLDNYYTDENTLSEGNYKTEEKSESPSSKMQRLKNMRNQLATSNLTKQFDISTHDSSNRQFSDNKQTSSHIEISPNHKYSLLNTTKETDTKSIPLPNLNEKIQQTSIATFEISNIRLAIEEDTTHQRAHSKTRTTIEPSKEESFNVVGMTPKPTVIVSPYSNNKQFKIENQSFNIKQLTTITPIAVNPYINDNENISSIPSEPNTTHPNEKLDKDKEEAKMNEETYQIYTVNRLDRFDSNPLKNNGKLINSNSNIRQDNSVNNQIDNFIQTLKMKNKTKDDNLATILNEKEKELRLLKERQEYIIKQKQLNQAKRYSAARDANHPNTFDDKTIVNYDTLDDEYNTNNELISTNGNNGTRIRKYVNREPIVFNEQIDNQVQINQTPPMQYDADPIANAHALLNQRNDGFINNAKSHKSIFSDEINNPPYQPITPKSIKKNTMNTRQNSNIDDLMKIGNDTNENNKEPKTGFFDFEKFTINTKREKELDKEREREKEKRMIEKNMYLNKVKEDLKQNEMSRKAKEDYNKMNNLVMPTNRNKYTTASNFIMPANSLEDVLESKDHYFFGK